MQPQVCDLDSRVVERPDHVREVGLSSFQANGDALVRAAAIPETGEDLGESRRLLGIGRDRLDGRTADLGLELVGRPFGDDVAVVDDPDTVGENVGLLEILGRQEDSDIVFTSEDYGPRYAAAVRRAAPGFVAPSDVSTLEVVERLEGNATTDFGVPAVAPESDRAPLGDAELEIDWSRLRVLPFWSE